jgi:DNA-directed RNA polymerase specialized sigma24 family protein
MLLDRERELIGVNADIMMTVDRIADPDERRVLMLRYVDQKQWIEIARAIPCSERSVYYLHGRALKSLEQILQSIADGKPV